MSINDLRKLSNCCKSPIEQDIGKNTCLGCGKDCDWTYDYPKKNMSISKIKEINKKEKEKKKSKKIKSTFVYDNLFGYYGSGGSTQFNNLQSKK